MRRQAKSLTQRDYFDSNGDVIIPSTYGSINNSMAPGTVIGIVLGSVAGFLFILWLFYAFATLGRGGGSEYAESVVVARRKSNAGSHHTARSRRVSENIEVRQTAQPIHIVREPSRSGRIVVEETRKTRRAVSPGGSDEVVVIEEHDSPRRIPRKDRRGSSGRH